MTVKIKIIPIRRRDTESGPWIMTEPHRAQQWAIGAFRRGHQVALILRGANKADMEGKVQSIERMFMGPARPYRLGKRMGKKEAVR